jgi:hypothetical protein
MEIHARSAGVVLAWPFAMRCVRPILALALTATPLLAHATVSRDAQVKRAVGDYVTARGFRAGAASVRVTGRSESGKSTRATLSIGDQKVDVAINDRTGRLQSKDVDLLISSLSASHVAYKRAGLGQGSKFATKLISYYDAQGRALRPALVPIGRPRAGQLASMLAFDALSLNGGAIELGFSTPIVAGPGAGVRVKENGLGAGPNIINQTPGIVYLGNASRYYRVGNAGYKTAGDVFLTTNAIDPIPAGTLLDRALIADAPSAPHTPDPTDNATAAARGVKGFDLVSVEKL